MQKFVLVDWAGDIKQPLVIAQFRLVCNQTPSSASWQQVTEWLNGAVGS